MLKEKVIEILEGKKAEEVAAVGGKYDALISEVDALEEPTGNEEVEQLKADLAAEKEKSAAVQKSYDEYVVSEDAEDVDQNAQIASGQKFRDAVKAALEG